MPNNSDDDSEMNNSLQGNDSNNQDCYNAEDGRSESSSVSIYIYEKVDLKIFFFQSKNLVKI